MRAGLGERRLVAAVRSLFVRHEVLRRDGFTAESCVHRIALPALAGRLVPAVRSDVLTALPWHVLLPGLVSAWTASAHLRARQVLVPAP